uniref:protein-serine/threonine phosphatase n=1 Tax=Sarcophilus harrisii TaxID=9305 RepID=A0A7N4PY32_SARHA
MSGWPWLTWSPCAPSCPARRPVGQCPGREGSGCPRLEAAGGRGRPGGPGLMGPARRHSEQEQMERLIRAELWEVLDTSDLESVTSKEVRGVKPKAPGWSWPLQPGVPRTRWGRFRGHRPLSSTRSCPWKPSPWPLGRLGAWGPPAPPPRAPARVPVPPAARPPSPDSPGPRGPPGLPPAAVPRLHRQPDAVAHGPAGSGLAHLPPPVPGEPPTGAGRGARGAGAGRLLPTPPSPQGSEWNAANLDELQRNQVSHILNVAREIDNFFPGLFTYHNVRLWDEETEQLLPHWKETHQFIEAARAQGSRVLVHCKMGVSRSAATVMAYAMKQYSWGLEQAVRHVQELRPIARPNPGFLRQLHTYQGILTASRQSHVWEQKAGGTTSPEEALAPDTSWLPPPSPREPGGSGDWKATGGEEPQGVPGGEAGRGGPGPRPRMDLRGIMRSISLLEPPDLGNPPDAGDLPEVRRGAPREPRRLAGQGRFPAASLGPASQTENSPCGAVRVRSVPPEPHRFLRPRGIVGGKRLSLFQTKAIMAGTKRAATVGVLPLVSGAGGTDGHPRGRGWAVAAPPGPRCQSEMSGGEGLAGGDRARGGRGAPGGGEAGHELRPDLPFPPPPWG